MAEGEGTGAAGMHSESLRGGREGGKGLLGGSQRAAVTGDGGFSPFPELEFVMIAAAAGKPSDTHPPRRDDSEAGTAARPLSPAVGANEEQEIGEAAAASRVRQRQQFRRLASGVERFFAGERPAGLTSRCQSSSVKVAQVCSDAGRRMRHNLCTEDKVA
ncbi:UNVERIFIED_CONTAM: hypothetical protein K2H54_038961 [Gekko kuhli]